MNIAEVRRSAVQRHGYVPSEVDVPGLADAACQLVQEIRRLQAELERECARTRDLARPEPAAYRAIPWMIGVTVVVADTSSLAAPFIAASLSIY